MISPKRIDGCALWQVPSTTCHCAARVIASWLNGVGSHISLVKEVRLDLEGICKTRCWVPSNRLAGLLHGTARETSMSAELDFTGFLKAVWQYGLRANMEVVRDESGPPAAYESHAALETHHISGTVQALCKDDIYLGRFWNTVFQVVVQPYGQSAKVLFKGTSIRGDGNPQEDFRRDVARAL